MPVLVSALFIGSIENTHHEFMFSAMNAQLFQPYGQVVDTNASISVDIQDLEKHFQPVLLIGTPTYRALMRGVAGLVLAVLGVRCCGMC